MRFNARKLILAGASLVIILTAIASLIYASRPSDNGSWIAQVNQMEPGSLTPSPSSPGPSDVNAAAFKGHGQLAFVCNGLLYVLDGDTGEVRRITGSGWASQPAWSHDGEWLAFLGATGPLATSVAWLVRWDGTLIHQVREAAPGNAFAWSPTGDLLSVSGQNGAWLVPVDGEPRYFPDASLDWAPDGKSLAYSITLPFDPHHLENRTDALYTVPIDNGPPVQRLTAPRSDGIIVAGWWHDGRGLLYWLDPDHSASYMADGADLYSLRLGDNEPRLLTSGLGYRGWLAAFPQNNLLMVKGRSRIVWADKNLAMINVEMGHVKDLKNPAGCVAIDPSLSEDGSRIAFVAARDLGDDVWGFNKAEDLTAWVATRTLWIENVDGSGARPLASAGEGVYQPLWSKDGRRILYVKDNSLWLIGAGGGKPEKICGPLAYDDPPAGPFGFYGFISYRNQMAWFQP